MISNDDIAEKLESLEQRIKALEKRTEGVAFGTVTVNSDELISRFVKELETRGIRHHIGEGPDEDAEGVPA